MLIDAIIVGDNRSVDHSIFNPPNGKITDEVSLSRVNIKHGIVDTVVLGLKAVFRRRGKSNFSRRQPEACNAHPGQITVVDHAGSLRAGWPMQASPPFRCFQRISCVVVSSTSRTAINPPRDSFKSANEAVSPLLRSTFNYRGVPIRKVTHDKVALTFCLKRAETSHCRQSTHVSRFEDRENSAVVNCPSFQIGQVECRGRACQNRRRPLFPQRWKVSQIQCESRWAVYSIWNAGFQVRGDVRARKSPSLRKCRRQGGRGRTRRNSSCGESQMCLPR